MKKIALVFCLVFCFALSKAQQSLLFKIKYLPDHTYESSVGFDMNMEMNFLGDSVTIKKIKASGTKLPMIINSETNMNMLIKTGSVKPDNFFPIAFNYKNIASTKTLNGNESPDAPNPLLGQTIYGRYSLDGKIQLDSMSGKNIDDQVKNIIKTAIDNLLNQIHFPDKPLSVGETFTQQVPFNLPLGGINMQFNIQIIYKLTSIDKDSAYFDIDESMNFDMSTQKDGKTIQGDGTGKGDGKLVYSIANNFATSMNTNLNFNFKMQMGALTVLAKAKMTSDNEAKISAN